MFIISFRNIYTFDQNLLGASDTQTTCSIHTSRCTRTQRRHNTFFLQNKISYASNTVLVSLSTDLNFITTFFFVKPLRFVKKFSGRVCGYRDWGLSWSFSVPPDECLDSTFNRSTTVFHISLHIYQAHTAQFYTAF